MSGGGSPRRRRWIRTRPGGRETLGAALAAGVVAAGVASVTFYLTRLFLAREPLDGPPGPEDGPRSSGGVGGA